MAKRKAGFPFDDDLFGNSFFNEFFANDAAFQDLFRQLGNTRAGPGNPMVYGFSVTTGPDGKPRVQEFGNVKKEGGVQNEREPLVDLIDCEKEVRVIMELPGVDRQHLHLTVENSELSVRVTDPDRRYAKTVRLPEEVKSSEVKATLKNGILEVVLPKAKPKGKAIKIN